MLSVTPVIYRQVIAELKYKSEAIVSNDRKEKASGKSLVNLPKKYYFVVNFSLATGHDYLQLYYIGLWWRTVFSM